MECGTLAFRPSAPPRRRTLRRRARGRDASRPSSPRPRRRTARSSRLWRAPRRARSRSSDRGVDRDLPAREQALGHQPEDRLVAIHLEQRARREQQQAGRDPDASTSNARTPSSRGEEGARASDWAGIPAQMGKGSAGLNRRRIRRESRTARRAAAPPTRCDRPARARVSSAAARRRGRERGSPCPALDRRRDAA